MCARSCHACRAKGNIVLTLDGQNAARLLLGLVQAMPETKAAQGKTAAERSQHKETEFYAAVFDRKPEVSGPVWGWLYTDSLPVSPSG